MNANDFIVQSHIRKWHPEEEPLLQEQCATLVDILGGTPLCARAFEGFLMISGRLFDETGNHRTRDRAKTFRTHFPAGRLSLVFSLKHFLDAIGGMERVEQDFSVSIIPPVPPVPSCPLVRIRYIDRIAKRVFRLLDPNGREASSGLPPLEYIVSKRSLPLLPFQRISAHFSAAREAASALVFIRKLDVARAERQCASASAGLERLPPSRVD